MTQGKAAAIMAHPSLLTGVRIIELGQLVAAPFATSLCADFGAEVIKIEDPSQGDSLRKQGPEKDGQKLWWKVAGRNKKCITLNLKDPRGLTLCRRLLEGADALVENYRPGVLDRLGLGNAALRELNPRLIIVSVSGYGQTGPYSPRPGYGKVAEAMSGIVHLTGDPDGPPRPPGVSLADATSGLMAAFSLAMALHQRDVRGTPPATVDLGLHETLARMLDWQIIVHDQLGTIPLRNGGKMPIDGGMLNNTYKTADDKWLVMSASAAMMRKMIPAMGIPELGSDPRFLTDDDASRNVAAFDVIVAGWIALRTRDETMRTMSAAGATCGAVYDVRDIVADPQYLARGTVTTVEDGDLGAVRMVGVVPTVPDAPGSIRWTGPRLGAHNAEVLGDILGLSGQEIQALRVEKVI